MIPGHFYVYRIWKTEAAVSCAVWEKMAGNPKVIGKADTLVYRLQRNV